MVTSTITVAEVTRDGNLENPFTVQNCASSGLEYTKSLISPMQVLNLKVWAPQGELLKSGYTQVMPPANPNKILSI